MGGLRLGKCLLASSWSTPAEPARRGIVAMAINFRGDACYVEVRVITTRFVSPIVGSLIENTIGRFAGLEKIRVHDFPSQPR